jgi:hypothetical protein
MPFPQVGDYGPYEDWSAEVEYESGDIVYHKGYLYKLMVDPSITPLYKSLNDDPLTSTFSYNFSDILNVNTRYAPTQTVPDPASPEAYTVRRWLLFSLPAGYYHGMLRRVRNKSVAPFDYIFFIQVNAAAQTLFLGPGEEPEDPLVIERDGYNTVRVPADECSYEGYELPQGLDVTYSTDNLAGGALLYSFSATHDEKGPLESARTIGPYNQVPTEEQEEGVGDDLNNGFSAGGIQQMHSSMQIFNRGFTWAQYGELEGVPFYDEEGGTTVAFTDNWTDVDPPPELKGTPVATSPDYLTG